MQNNIRKTLLTILEESENNTLNNALERAFKENDYTLQEKSYITNMSHQVLRYKLRFEALIHIYCHKKNDINQKAKNILIIALCEIYCMQSIPIHASINEAVELAKKNSPKEVALINGVLREIDRNFPHKELDKDKFIKKIKIIYPKKTLLELEACYSSLPSFILDIIRKQYGKEYAELYLKTLNEIPYYNYRFNVSKENWKEKREELAQSSNIGKDFSLSGYSLPTKNQKATEFYEQGILSYQGASSQIAIEKILPFIKEKNCSVWDACCGVGGKSLALAEHGVKISLASDINQKRLDIYKQENIRLGLSTIETKQGALQEIDFTEQEFILLDSPCSGLGTLTANPDLRYKITKKSLQETIALQKDLLNIALNKLAKQGILCYITCSLNRVENEEQIEQLVSTKKMQCLHFEYIKASVCGADTLFIALLQKI